jgi:hypothetical protein
MRLVAVLVVLAVVGWLGARQLHSSGGGPSSAPAAQRVVDGARADLQRAQATRQAQLDQRLQGADQP